MFLKSLKLQNFRNYSAVDYEFKTPVTVLVGNNAQGKSNFLESIYFLSTTKSPKADEDMELIKKGETVLRVEGQVENKEEISLEIVMQESDGNLTKKAKVNGIPRRVLDYIGNLSVVSFTPEDINLVTGSPSLRRWHIDLTLAQIDRSYKSGLTNYGEVIIRKNRLLKMIREGEARVDELDFWIDQQLQFGEIICRKRRLFFEFLNSDKNLGLPSKGHGDFRFEYLENVLNRDRLIEYQSREIASATSLIGPHRDDFLFTTVQNGDSKGRNLRQFGSRGEHRTAVLDLKLTEASFIETVIGSRPILLLDDVFSELDDAHQKHVLELVNLQQTVIATVEVDELLRKSLKNATYLSVASGKLSATTGK